MNFNFLTLIEEDNSLNRFFGFFKLRNIEIPYTKFAIHLVKLIQKEFWRFIDDNITIDKNTIFPYRIYNNRLHFR